MKKAYGLSSWDEETKFSGICTAKELIEEAADIISERGLALVAFTEDDKRWVWKDFNYERNSPKVTRSVVSSSNWREHYDLRVLCWLYEWYGRHAELRDLENKSPAQSDYLMYFTMRGDISWLNLKQTTFYKCLEYMRRLEMGRWQRGSIGVL